MPDEWMFKFTVTGPAGIRVQVTIAVPVAGAWGTVLETGEIAQMTATKAMNQITQCITNSEEPPF